MLAQATMWEKLGQEPVDVLVVGGGINGAGIARDAANRGLNVALVEMRDLAYGTSSRSSKMVHGGLRYLEQFAFGLVFESVSERRILLKIAPHLVRPLGYIFPIFKTGTRGLGMVSLGMWVYEALSLFRSPRRHKTLKAHALSEVEPIVDTQGMLGAPLYYDCATDDARLTLESALDAAHQGAIVSTWTRVTQFEKDDSGNVLGVRVKNELTGEEKSVKASLVVNATGPWTDKTRGLSKEAVKPMVMRTKGVHVVVSRKSLPVNHCVICPHPDDARGVFAVPWGEQTYIGNTDTAYGKVEGGVTATLNDVDYLLEASNTYFPGHQLDRNDVIATWAGLRPLLAPESDDISNSKVTREHSIEVGADGVVTVAGGKLTTYRKMANEVVTVSLKALKKRGHKLKTRRSTTAKVALPGAQGMPRGGLSQLKADLVQNASGVLPPEICESLVDTYGVRAADVVDLVKKKPELANPLIKGRHEIAAQVVFAVESEFAATATDFLIQRTQIFYRDDDQGLGALHEVVRIMTELLLWNDARQKTEIARYQNDVATSRGWRDEIAQEKSA
ncbi:MAG: glycerol-3-phosphate dehydrogenase [Deltaproteobacteria bacterium]|jgi:glycerol-3-phosphate dehydrogenase|nr:glycerol-3-phosphate dehydrogenase [Deltaproteobacteria bacterium]MBT6490174.1 glycerol-3-phosphate dehydrogenase [Deltaproteobacteria bacterium]